MLARIRTTRPGAAALAAMATLTVALAVVSISFPLLPADPPWPRIDLGARARLAALDGFDSRARPGAVVYNPLRVIAAAELIPQLALGVKPLQRTDRQPVRVIHNGRFSLPAGSYELTVAFGDRVPSQPMPLSLQVGRLGPPIRTWELQPAAGEQWKTQFDLALDVRFVGLRGPVELEQAISSMTIAPISVVDAGRRPHLPPVLAAAVYSGVTVYFHNEQMYPEPQGFWTTGRMPVEVTVAVPPTRSEPAVLTIHCGARANNVRISALGWERSYSLTPGHAETIALPVMADGIIPLTISTDNGFSPSDVDPRSKDQRFLGIWVEVARQ